MTWQKISKNYILKYRITNEGRDAVLNTGKYARWKVSDIAKDERGIDYLKFMSDHVDDELFEIIGEYI